MNAEEFKRRWNIIQRDMPLQLLQFADVARARIAANAISKQMRKGDVALSTPVDPKKLTVRTGRLARSLTGQNRDEAIFEKTLSNSLLQIVIGSLVPYARVHEDGFSGLVNVRQHRRQGHTVRAHSRMMRMPKRPYLTPAVKDEQTKIASLLRSEFLKFFNERLN